MGYGQHQTFYLRQQWINKGLKEVKRDPRFFYTEDHFEILGVGKNMAKSIRFWLNATQLTVEKRTTQVEIVPTNLADLINKYDPFIKSKNTLCLLHYLLVTEQDEATTWYWFFNIFDERVFSKNILIESITRWIKEKNKKEVSTSTLKKDIDCLIQLYTPKEYQNKTPEDVIKSPFEILEMIQNTTGTTYIKTKVNHKHSIHVLYITLIKYFEKNSVNEINLNELLSGEELWGRVFNLDRDTVLMYINAIQELYPIQFIQTNNLDVIRLEEEVNWLDELKEMYEQEMTER